MVSSQEIISQIDKRLEQFFSKSDEDYCNRQIFTELFEYLEISKLESIDQTKYKNQVYRLRDLKNCIDIAYEDGLRAQRNET